MLVKRGLGGHKHEEHLAGETHTARGGCAAIVLLQLKLVIFRKPK
jgi:hypothetical protein